MRKYKYLTLGGIILAMNLTSCVGDLNVEPTDESNLQDITTKQQYMEYLAGCYYGLVKEGGITSGATGGESVYTRIMVNLQELPTDEMVISGNWNDAGIVDLVYATPSSDNHWIYDMYSRLNAHIAVCNQFIQDIDKAGDLFTADEIKEMKAEVRVLRDLGYYNMIDMFGHGPWADENHKVGTDAPTYNRAQLFDAIVNDLVDAVPQVYPASQQEYGRVSREAGYALLAKMYLNAEVYLGKGNGKWQQCADACQAIINSGMVLAKNYAYLFCGSNAKYVASSTKGATGEILWSVPQDAVTMQCFGGTTYLSGGAYPASLNATEKKKTGVGADGWGGPHMRPETVNNFTDPNDVRAMFYSEGFNNDIKDISTWGGEDSDGYMCVKFVYTNEDDYYNTSGTSGSGSIFNSADFPIFRLADIYLMMVECEINGANVEGGALQYYQAVQRRAGITALANSLPDKRELLDERNRELYWEGHRRSDMIRLGFYTGSDYIWKWKGGVYEGTSTESFRNLLPIPTPFVSTLGQNQGY